MKTCLVLFDRVNLLSFARIYDLLKREKIAFDIVSFRDDCKDEFGLALPNASKHGESLLGYDVVVIPDGLGALNLRYDDIFLSWIKGAKDAKIKVGVDLGGLILGGAGLLGKKAVVRGGYINAMSEYAQVIDANFNEENGVITALNSEDSLNKLVKAIYG